MGVETYFVWEASTETKRKREGREDEKEDGVKARWRLLEAVCPRRCALLRKLLSLKGQEPAKRTLAYGSPEVGGALFAASCCFFLLPFHDYAAVVVCVSKGTRSRKEKGKWNGYARENAITYKYGSNSGPAWEEREKR